MRKVTKQTAIVVAITVGMCAKLALVALEPSPKHDEPTHKYDLLFSVDTNDVPYSDPDSKGIVIRVQNNKAKVIFRGWGDNGFDVPDLYICNAETGKLGTILIPFPTYPALRTQDINRPTGLFVDAPDLQRLTVDDSSMSPGGYSLSGLDFSRTYGIIDLVMPSPFSPFPRGKGLTENAYKECLQRVAGHQAGLTVHFVGWVMQQSKAKNWH